MKEWHLQPSKNAAQYCIDRSLILGGELGGGVDGIVYSVVGSPGTAASAVKALAYEPLYQRERDVYLRLQEYEISEVRGMSVPTLVDFDDHLWVVEMEIVRPPFVLDFAGAYLDTPPDFPSEIMEAWEADRRELFGDHWPTVRSVMNVFASMGIYLSDVKPGNVTFAE